MTLASPPYVLQAGTVSHGAQLFRNAISSLVGTVGRTVSPGDLAVTQNATPNMSVNVGAGQVWIPGSQAGTFPSGAQIQGAYYSESTATETKTINAADPTNPRIDQIIAQVQDAAYAGAANSCQTAVITGTPTAGASLANLVGLGTFPPASSSALLLAYVLVPANATSIVTNDIKNVASGGWSALTLSTSPSVLGLGASPPAARLESLDVVRLSGQLENNSGASIAAGTALATIPAGLQTSRSPTPNCSAYYNQSPFTIGINILGGQIKAAVAVAAGAFIDLDGVTYTLT